MSLCKESITPCVRSQSKGRWKDGAPALSRGLCGWANEERIVKATLALLPTYLVYGMLFSGWRRRRFSSRPRAHSSPGAQRFVSAHAQDFEEYAPTLRGVAQHTFFLATATSTSIASHRTSKSKQLCQWRAPVLNRMLVRLWRSVRGACRAAFSTYRHMSQSLPTTFGRKMDMAFERGLPRWAVLSRTAGARDAARASV